LVDDIAFAKYKWESDPELEKLAAHLQGKFVRFEKVQRNDPCPCGSGKKFKRCHGA
jgi:uncharacterized protein YecA (UPF0149 family)